jgi:putative transposase
LDAGKPGTDGTFSDIF